MVRRPLVIAVLLALLALPGTALGQTPTATPTAPPSGAFGPLPDAAATPAPTVAQDESNDSLSSDLGGTTTLYLIGALLLVAFIGIGMFISRDARRALPKDHRPDSHRLREEGPHRHKRQAKERARQRTKAQRAARRKNR
jgi:hypothetical protein